MKKELLKHIVLLFLLLVLQNATTAFAQVYTIQSGVVYHDKNKNGEFDSFDEPLEGVAVSNGRDVVTTNSKGEYEIELRDNAATFVIKPRNWSVKIDEKQVPRFYKMNSSTGLSGNKYAGLEPTELQHRSVNFPLYPLMEPNNIKGLIFGDTQPRNQKEIYYMSQDIIADLVGVDADFGVTLGDVVFNDLNLFEHVANSLSVIGIPMWYVPGNHDVDYTAKNSIEGRGSWFNSFGPNYYSFSYGPAHFVVLDNIQWSAENENSNWNYRTGLGDDQMTFLENEVKRLDDDQWLVVMSHIPFEGSTAWEDELEKKAFFELLSQHKKSIALSGHTHIHYHHSAGKEEGFYRNEPLHMISVGTVCGEWWGGAPTVYGIPHAMMSDGTPNGYAFLYIDEDDLKLEWRVAGKPSDFQMTIDAPDVISSESDDKILIRANIFNALPNAEVKMKIGEDGDWIEMNRSPQKDPVRLAAKEIESKIDKTPWRKIGQYDATSNHIWEADLNSLLGKQSGVYCIYIKSKDKWFEYEGKRLIHLK